VFAFAEWEQTEDHLAAVCFNAMAIMYYQEQWKDHLLNDFEWYWVKEDVDYDELTDEIVKINI
jgi:hypothetical protein